MSRRSDVLELAILGVLLESPMHGYEVRKQLHVRLGVFRTLSYGTLYPVLRVLVDKGWISQVAEDTLADQTPRGLPSKRARIVYEITGDGKDHFHSLMNTARPWDDDSFNVHFAFFGRADAATRLRILEGRRLRVQEDLESTRSAANGKPDRWDDYAHALHRHDVEATEREVRWLSELIDQERAGNMTHLADPDAASQPPTT